MFLKSIEKTRKLISDFGNMFNNVSRKDEITDFFNVKNSKSFRRSYQDFYITWLVLNFKQESTDATTIKAIIKEMLVLLKNANNVIVNKEYFKDFSERLENIINKQ